LHDTKKAFFFVLQSFGIKVNMESLPIGQFTGVLLCGKITFLAAKFSKIVAMHNRFNHEIVHTNEK